MPSLGRISNKVIIEVISSFTPSVPKEEIEKYEKEAYNYKNNKSDTEGKNFQKIKRNRK